MCVSPEPLLFTMPSTCPLSILLQHEPCVSATYVCPLSAVCYNMSLLCPLSLLHVHLCPLCIPLQHEPCVCYICMSSECSLLQHEPSVSTNQLGLHNYLLEVTKEPSTLEYYLSVLYKWLLSSHTARLLYANMTWVQLGNNCDSFR